MDLNDNPWIILGLSMDRLWIIHGLSIDHPWIIYGSSMDYLWIIHGHPGFPWTPRGWGNRSAMLGEPASTFRGNRSGGKHERLPHVENKNPSRQAWLGKNIYHSSFHIYHFPLTSEGVQVQPSPAWVGHLVPSGAIWCSWRLLEAIIEIPLILNAIL